MANMVPGSPKAAIPSSHPGSRAAGSWAARPLAVAPPLRLLIAVASVCTARELCSGRSSVGLGGSAPSAPESVPAPVRRTARLLRTRGPLPGSGEDIVVVPDLAVVLRPRSPNLGADQGDSGPGPKCTQALKWRYWGGQPRGNSPPLPEGPTGRRPGTPAAAAIIVEVAGPADRRHTTAGCSLSPDASLLASTAEKRRASSHSPCPQRLQNSPSGGGRHEAPRMTGRRHCDQERG